MLVCLYYFILSCGYFQSYSKAEWVVLLVWMFLAPLSFLFLWSGKSNLKRKKHLFHFLAWAYCISWWGRHVAGIWGGWSHRIANKIRREGWALVLNLLSLFLFLFSVRPLPMVWSRPHSGWVFPPLLSLWKHPRAHSQRCMSWVLLSCQWGFNHHSAPHFSVTTGTFSHFGFIYFCSGSVISLASVNSTCHP